jgi:hypothetical protein
MEGSWVQCTCGAQFYTNSACNESRYPPKTVLEYQDVCMSNVMPLGSWPIAKWPNTSNPIGALGMSYMFTNCTSNFGTTQVVGVNDKISLVQYYQWNTTSCDQPTDSVQKFPPDGSCQPIWVFSDLFYAKFYCANSAMSVSVLSQLMTLLLGVFWASWVLSS